MGHFSHRLKILLLQGFAHGDDFFLTIRHEFAHERFKVGLNMNDHRILEWPVIGRRYDVHQAAPCGALAVMWAVETE
jgi:hypothetical protein